jgi:hypothetical protein
VREQIRVTLKSPLSLQDTLQDEPMDVGAERFCNGNHAPDDAPRADPLRGGLTIWSREVADPSSWRSLGEAYASSGRRVTDVDDDEGIDFQTVS